MFSNCEIEIFVIEFSFWLFQAGPSRQTQQQARMSGNGNKRAATKSATGMLYSFLSVRLICQFYLSYFSETAAPKKSKT